jgi:ABC-type uncharacterized transport system involved in gliding motility auxiliary subunit
MNKNTFALSGLGVLILLFFGANLFGGAIFKSVRLDLTEAELFTLSDGTKNVLSEMDESVTLRLYYSREVATKKAPGLLGYAQRVTELLEKYESQSNGKLELLVIDPERFSEEEEEAVSYGLKPTPVSQAGDLVYFGLAATNDVGDEDLIPFFVPSRENFLEYDLTKLVYGLTHIEKHSVGVLSALPIQGSPPNPMNPQSRGSEPWYFLTKLRKSFDVVMIERRATELPSDIDILLLLHPKELDDGLLFDIDQFALGGGKVIAFLDPHCELDSEGINPQDRMSAFSANRTSDLGPLLGAWGVELVSEKLAADRENARIVPVGPGEQLPYLIWPELPAKNVSPDDPIARDLKKISMLAGGILNPTDGATTDFSRLLWTSEDSMELERFKIAMGPDPAGLLKDFVPLGKELTLGARIHGFTKTAYPDGPPEKPVVEGEEPPPVRIPPEGGWKTEGEIQVVAIADADMLYQELWVDIARLGNMQLEVGTKSNNYDLLVNAIDNLTGNEDLISLRSRPGFNRPFTLVEEMLEDANTRFQAEKQALEDKLANAEQRINELQSQKDGGVESMILSPEQSAAIEEYRKEQLVTKRKLRDVNHSLMKDIESLGSRIKFINIVALPLLITLLAAALGLYRLNRKRS